MGTQIKQTQLFTRGSLTAGTTSRLWRNNSRFGHCGRVPTAHRNQKTAVRPRLRYRVQVPARGLFPIQARHPCVHFAISPTATSALPSESVTRLNPPLLQRPLPTDRQRVRLVDVNKLEYRSAGPQGHCIIPTNPSKSGESEPAKRGFNCCQHDHDQRASEQPFQSVINTACGKVLESQRRHLRHRAPQDQWLLAAKL